jgi:pimeloyl-ACP methyl ester carboxylesterase
VLSVFAHGRIFGESYGEPSRATQVLALHGWGRSRRDFATVLAGLPAVALDLPGFGSSPPPEQVCGSAGYAELVASAAEEVTCRQPAVTAPDGAGGLLVLGHSFGGCVAVQLAAARPDLVASLVLCGVPRLARGVLPPARPKLAYRALRGLRRAGLVGESRLEAARRRYGSADYRNADGVMREVLVRVLAEDLEDQVRLLRCPVELVWGEEDTAAPIAVARRVAELLPGAALRALPGVGHLVPLEAPQPLREAVEAGLARLACPA